MVSDINTGKTTSCKDTYNPNQLKNISASNQFNGLTIEIDSHNDGTPTCSIVYSYIPSNVI